MVDPNKAWTKRQKRLTKRFEQGTDKLRTKTGGLRLMSFLVKREAQNDWSLAEGQKDLGGKGLVDIKTHAILAFSQGSFDRTLGIPLVTPKPDVFWWDTVFGLASLSATTSALARRLSLGRCTHPNAWSAKAKAGKIKFDYIVSSASTVLSTSSTYRSCDQSPHHNLILDNMMLSVASQNSSACFTVSCKQDVANWKLGSYGDKR